MDIPKFKLSEDPKELEKISAYLNYQENLERRSKIAEIESHKRLDPILKNLYLKALKEIEEDNEKNQERWNQRTTYTATKERTNHEKIQIQQTVNRGDYYGGGYDGNRM